ncbi:MAG: hypothetical protein JST00_20915 [Deltaproteobacteria bacterium]|nr:hypothetical protein [Deltaproteobacteria bacterium]
MRLLRFSRRAPALVAVVSLLLAGGCASLLGLDEVTESNGPGEEAGTETDATTDVASDGPKPDGTTTDGGTDARADAPTDAPRDVDADARPVDAGCGATIGTDFGAAALPPQITTSSDGASTIVFDNMGVGGSRAAHLTVPMGSKTAELLVNIASLQTDGALQCAVTCSVDVRLLQRGVNAEVRLLTLEQSAGAPNFVSLVHSNTSTYFSRSGMALEAPDLGTTGNGAFTTLSIDVSGNAAPFTGKGSVGATTNTKALTFDPTSARVGITKVDTDPVVEAIFDNLVCRSHN